ncbi:hypothetical protein F4778DRAFT_419725 [Xylariomycetidae sp. FL2044]|nr:hypothetical protein F4778DRAFT_419725 [Xylariomycetidae sp. FL2044]
MSRVAFQPGCQQTILQYSVQPDNWLLLLCPLQTMGFGRFGSALIELWMRQWIELSTKDTDMSTTMDGKLETEEARSVMVMVVTLALAVVVVVVVVEVVVAVVVVVPGIGGGGAATFAFGLAVSYYRTT